MAIRSEHGIQLEPYQVVLRPLVTEKGTFQSSTRNQYAFEVATNATKLDIRRAVQELFKVRVVAVRTQMRNGKPRRTKMMMVNLKPWKKALVTLHSEDAISLF